MGRVTVLEQPDLEGRTHTVAANGKPLSEKQERGWALVKTTPGGITADELGAIFHEQRGRHHRDHRCIHCASEGRSVLDSVALKPLVIKRRQSLRYEPREKRSTAPLADLVEPSEAELAQNPFAGLS